MAQGTQETEGANAGAKRFTPADNAALWATSAANVGYAVHNGLPVIGIAGDEGDGQLVAVPAPAWFYSVATEGERDNAFRGMAAHALRVGQGKLKAAGKDGNRTHAMAGVVSAIDGSYKPSKDRATDILDSESAKAFAAHIEGLVRAKKPDATAAEVGATIEKHSGTDAGKALIAKFRNEIIERGTYTVVRKGKKGVESASVDIGDLS